MMLALEFDFCRNVLACVPLCRGEACLAPTTQVGNEDSGEIGEH